MLDLSRRGELKAAGAAQLASVLAQAAAQTLLTAIDIRLALAASICCAPELFSKSKPL